ncbi:feruloyl esterase B precursor (subclass of the carboxylic acid esterase) [Fusarium beomiforme]|uniref:Feruloyl esterase B (Subclass of the carboxylic acid esterase) n=1 Tax=Fusarium beomiforme TaxID=44412 RepID=A0A9P5A9V7_9HYPO|nr:feruloyl esterase B precursor (subclass of the carboxylic acid esterase) [Fusarium beomiforme]
MLDYLSPRKLLTQLSLGASLVAAQLQTITNFGSTYNTQLIMQAYIPSNLPSSPAVVLALHPCGGSGSGYFQQTQYRSFADSRGVILIYPSSQKDSNCWDVASAKTLKHDGQGDSQVLVSMVDYVIKTYKADPKKVFVTGSSSGCMMTNVLAATYPDRFAAATCYSGVAAGCMAGSPGSSPISSDRVCSDGKIRKTGQEWANQVRAMYPGYSGSYPRFKTYHGTADYLVFYQNLLEQIKEWSTIQGVSFTRNETSTPQSGYTTMIYGDGTKFVAVSAAGVGHTVPVHGDLDFKCNGPELAIPHHVYQPSSYIVCHDFKLTLGKDAIATRQNKIRETEVAIFLVRSSLPLEGRQGIVDPGIEKRFGHPYWHVHRADLHDALVQRLRELGVSIKLNSLVVKVAVGKGTLKPRVTLSSGEVIEGDFLVGAHGIRSKVRETRIPGGAAAQGDWRLGVPLRDTYGRDEEECKHSAACPDPGVTSWWGPRKQVVGYMLHNQSIYNVVAVFPDDGSVWSGTKAARTLEHIGELYRDWCPLVTNLIQMAEPAAALTECLWYLPNDLSAAAAVFTKIRKSRATQVQQFARAQRARNHLPDGPEQQERDAAISKPTASHAWKWEAENGEPAKDWITGLHSYDAESAAKCVLQSYVKGSKKLGAHCHQNMHKI